MGTKSWRVRTPLVIQMEASECGAAALGIVLGYYKKFVSLGELRYQCSVTCDGVSMLNIVQAAEHYGLKGTGARTTFLTLETCRKPVIILWNSSHYVVLEGFKGGRVYINDPEHGPISFSREEFHTHYSGVAIFLDLTEDFKKSEVKVGMWQRLKERWRERFSANLFLLLSGLILFIPTLTVPLMLRLFIDNLYRSNNISWKLECLLFLVVAAGLGMLLVLFHSQVLKKITHRLSLGSSSRVFHKLLALPLSFYQQRDPNEMAKRIKVAGEMTQKFSEEFVPTLIELILSFFYGIMMFFYSPIVASLTLLGALICLAIQGVVSQHHFALCDTLKRDLKLSEMCSLDRLHNIDIIKAAGSETFFFRKWVKHYTLFLNTDQDVGKKEAALTLFPFFIQFFCTALLIGVGSFEVFSGHLSLGMLAALQLFLILFLAPLKKITLLSETINQMRRDVGRVDDLTHSRLDPLFELQKKRKALFGHLEFKKVCFGYYPSHPPFLKEISFTLEPKKWLGVSGPTGSGKSTLGKLAAALYQPTSGEVLYGGKQGIEIEMAKLRSSLGWVGQETLFFTGSCRDNITFWNHKIPDKVLEEVEELVGFKLRGLVREEGKNLSRGEKQQLEMARILLKKPELLIYDNAMSAVDRSIQERIFEALHFYGCACIFISHDPIFLSKCDEILKLEKGEVLL